MEGFTNNYNSLQFAWDFFYLFSSQRGTFPSHNLQHFLILVANCSTVTTRYWIITVIRGGVGVTDLPNEVKRASHFWNIIHGERVWWLKVLTVTWWINAELVANKSSSVLLSRERERLQNEEKLLGHDNFKTKCKTCRRNFLKRVEGGRNFDRKVQKWDQISHFGGIKRKFVLIFLTVGAAAHTLILSLSLSDSLFLCVTEWVWMFWFEN